jgi:lipopolysaccharide export system permease protein
VLLATAVVMLALLALLGIYDTLRELNDLGRYGNQIGIVFAQVALAVPEHLYTWLPIAALIGALYAIARLSEQSELTVMRSSGLSLIRLGGILSTVGALVACSVFAIGEWAVPRAEEFAAGLRLTAAAAVSKREFRSGFWIKDERRFINVGDVSADNPPRLTQLRIHQFDERYRLVATLHASEAIREGDSWILVDLLETRFASDGGATLRRARREPWDSPPSADLLSALRLTPDKMSAAHLMNHIDHLKANQQRSTRYEIAFWAKLMYPAATIVFMLLAVPFAVASSRRAGVGARITLGVLIGVLFHFLTRLTAHVGQLNDWPALHVGVAPTAIFLLLAAAGIHWTERR